MSNKPAADDSETRLSGQTAMIQRDPELQLVIDEAAIRRLIMKYPPALDRHNTELHASLFHPGAVDDHGPYNGPAEGFVAWQKDKDVPGFHWMHHYGTQNIEVLGDVGHVETYCLAFYRVPERPGYEKFLRIRYLDKVERRDGRWGIIHRRVVYGACQLMPIAEDLPLPTHLTDAAWPNDAVFRW